MRKKYTWETTKEMYSKLPRMQPLTETKMTSPTFKTILELVKAVVINFDNLKDLYTNVELQYSNYLSLESTIGFVDRLIQFLQSATGKKINLAPKMLLGTEREPEMVHELLQMFFKVASKGKFPKSTVKNIKKVDFLKLNPDSKQDSQFSQTSYGKTIGRGRSRELQRQAAEPERTKSEDSKPKPFITLKPSKTPWVLNPISEEEKTPDATPMNAGDKFAKRAEDKNESPKEQENNKEQQENEDKKTQEEREVVVKELEKLNAEFHRLLSQVDKNKSTMQTLQLEKARLHTQNRIKAQELDKLSKYRNADTEISEQEKEVNDLKTESREIDNKIAAQTDRITELGIRISTKKRENERKIAEHLEELEKLKAEKENLMETIKSRDKERSEDITRRAKDEEPDVAIKKSEIASLNRENQRLQQELDIAKIQYDIDIREFTQEVDDRNVNIAKYKEEIDKLTAEISQVKQELKPYEEIEDNKLRESQALDYSISQSKDTLKGSKLSS